MDNDVISGEPLGPRVTTVMPMEDHRLFLIFTNGEQRIFDAKPLLSFEAFKPLQNRHLFEAVKVAYGSVLWPNDIDYCPDTLYAKSSSVFDALTPDDIAAHNAAMEEYKRGECIRHEDINWD